MKIFGIVNNKLVEYEASAENMIEYLREIILKDDFKTLVIQK